MSGCSGSVSPACGSGSSIGHAGELLQGVIGNESFLVTLPAPPFASRATICNSTDRDDIVRPLWKTKALRAARIAWTRLGDLGGSLKLTVESEIPVGRGCGSSTSDCVAAIRAVADLLGRRVPADEIARWATEAEIAADATMFDLQPVAFLPRRGELLRPLGQAYPPLQVIAADLGGPSVDTIDYPTPAYSPAEIARFLRLLEQLERAIEQKDAAGVATVATESSELHQRHQPHPRWSDFLRVARRHGVLGAARSHSGTVAAALLAPQQAAAGEDLVRDLGALHLPVLTRYELMPERKGESRFCLSY